MPRHILSFRIPRERRELRAAILGAKALAALARIDEVCRQFVKHSAKPSRDAVDLAERVRMLVPVEAIDPEAES